MPHRGRTTDEPQRGAPFSGRPLLRRIKRGRSGVWGVKLPTTLWLQGLPGRRSHAATKLLAFRLPQSDNSSIVHTKGAQELRADARTDDILHACPSHERWLPV
jgi:hypothetical protein